MEDINKLCKNCKHWRFTIAVNQQYVGICRVKNQHLALVNGNEKGCIFYKSKRYKNESY